MGSTELWKAPVALGNEEEWRIIAEAFNDWVKDPHPIAVWMRRLPDFEQVKHSKLPFRIRLADKRYLYWEACMEHEKDLKNLNNPAT